MHSYINFCYCSWILCRTYGIQEADSKKKTECSHTFCNVKHMELIAPSFSNGVSVFNKHCSAICMDAIATKFGNAIATKYGQLVLKKRDHATPPFSHRPISLVQRMQFPPLQCSGIQSVKRVVERLAINCILSTKPV